ncbi:MULTISPECIES: hypothetical protein [Cytobacillus]|uniref:Lipoprotein n=2 Tax=Cytobacillus TaxID=2675230 RepID=A0AA46P6E5_CYTFI|nr:MULTISPECIES: hypothetical protein [Cytobacillus]AND43118.1 hypothetical protein A361_28545 [Cytobacillus oceanisediminis 2691]MCM3245643.1 hypothetical protein [Cytobacillus oceanisediminis]UQX57028.1 hypothetical protein M5V91_28170 [Cytobacillus pseudoceanisediminis]USK47343.1 hypothetical protein LIT27_29660 [Cytobacillus oceanisediminis]UYG98186.1 hypothetical protein OD459_27300 [Cytobacillus firmus]
MKVKAISLILSSSMLLTGCGGLFDKESKRIEALKEEKKQGELKDSKEKEEQEKIYKDMERPVNEVVYENELDTLKEVENLDYKNLEEYKDAAEFSKFVADALYKFYTVQLSPENYYEFLLQYGTESVKESLPSKDDAVTVFSSLQDLYLKQNINGESYTLTNVTFNRLKNEGSFYRKVLTTNGEEYFISIIQKENGVWKYADDSPSPPYEVQDNAS